MAAGLDWARDGRDWPHHRASRFVTAGGVRWHVQQLPPEGPREAHLLLLHGTGASSHSWRDLMEPLARHHHVTVIDLPGHAFSGAPQRADGYTLPGMAAALAALLRALAIVPDVIVGHSAGAAIAARLCLDHAVPARGLVSVNGAWLPWGGLAGAVFPPAARLLAWNAPWIAPLFARRARRPEPLQRLIDGTGSKLDAAGAALYRRLIGDPRHVAAALRMMASWDLAPLERDLPRLRPALHLLVGDNDRTVPPDQAWAVKARVPGVTLTRLPGLGHLAHEEQPLRLVALIEAIAGGVVNPA